MSGIFIIIQRRAYGRTYQRRVGLPRGPAVGGGVVGMGRGLRKMKRRRRPDVLDAAAGAAAEAVAAAAGVTAANAAADASMGGCM